MNENINENNSLNNQKNSYQNQNENKDNIDEKLQKFQGLINSDQKNNQVDQNNFKEEYNLQQNSGEPENSDTDQIKIQNIDESN